MKHIQRTAILVTILLLLLLSVLPAYAQVDNSEQNAPLPQMSDDTLSIDRQQLAAMRTAERRSRMADRASTAASRSTNQTIEPNTPYYIVDYATGLLLTYNTTSASVFASSYNDPTISNNTDCQKWYIDQSSNGRYVFLPVSQNYQALSINASSQSLGLQFRQNFSNQEWFIEFDDDGIATVTSAYSNNADYYQKELFYDFNDQLKWVVEDNLGAGIGLFKASEFAAPTEISHYDIYLAKNQTDFTAEPTGNTTSPHINNNWMYWTSSDSNVVYAYGDGRLHGRNTGRVTLTFEDVITGVTGECEVFVYGVSNGTHTFRVSNTSSFVNPRNADVTDNTSVYTIHNRSYNWIFQINNQTGYYSIKTIYSGFSFYITANSDQSIRLYQVNNEENLTANQQWKIQPAGTDFKIIPKSAEPTYSLEHTILDDLPTDSAPLKIVERNDNYTKWCIE